MALNQSQQILELIKRSEAPLICIAEDSGTDGFASALGLSQALNKLDCQPTLVSGHKKPPKNISFIKGYDQIKTKIEHLRRYVVELDASQTKVKELSYEMKDKKLKIFLSPDQGSWKKDDLKFLAKGYGYDLIFTIGATGLDALGELFSTEPDFFFETPIVNIDHSPQNEQFGEINVVDLTAAACGEVCHQLINDLEASLLDEDMATAFLTGIIAKTKSFKNPNIKPKTLERASTLMAYGAKRDLIVKELYRTRSVGTLRLWGRVLARLKSINEAGLVWSLLTKQDFVHAGAEEDDLIDVIDELIASSPQAEVVVLFYENNQNEICAVIRALGAHNALNLTKEYPAAGNNDLVRLCFKDKNIIQIEKQIIENLRKSLQEK